MSTSRWPRGGKRKGSGRESSKEGKEEKAVKEERKRMAVASGEAGRLTEEKVPEIGAERRIVNAHEIGARTKRIARAHAIGVRIERIAGAKTEKIAKVHAIAVRTEKIAKVHAIVARTEKIAVAHAIAVKIEIVRVHTIVVRTERIAAAHVIAVKKKIVRVLVIEVRKKRFEMILEIEVKTKNLGRVLLNASEIPVRMIDGIGVMKKMAAVSAKIANTSHEIAVLTSTIKIGSATRFVMCRRVRRRWKFEGAAIIVAIRRKMAGRKVTTELSQKVTCVRRLKMAGITGE